MCNPLPGVRCTSHSRARFMSAQESLNKVTNDYNKIKNGRNAQKKTQLIEKIDQARAKVNIREREYYASPGGIKELEEAIENKEYTVGDAESLASKLELAIYDKETQTLAAKLFKNYHKIQQDNQQLQDKLLHAERSALSNIAMLENTHGTTSYQAITARKHAQTAITQRKRFDEAVRRSAAGISNHENSIIKSDEAYQAFSTGTKDQNQKLFLPMQSESFGRANNYLPIGAYAQITSMKKNNYGTIDVIVENCHGVKLPKDFTVLKSTPKTKHAK